MTKTIVLDAIKRRQKKKLRQISEQFYSQSGIYSKLCQYMAFLYKYDWYITPFLLKDSINENRVLKDFANVLNYLDNSDLKRLFGSIALEVLKTGCYYGIILENQNKLALQQLPPDYCRVRFYSGLDPVIELDLNYFDNVFPNAKYKLKVLSVFPKEIQKAWVDWKNSKLNPPMPGDSDSWVALDPETTIRFNLNNSDIPPFINVIPSILDLDDAQELDRKKMMQQLLKIIIQHLPRNKNDELIFDVDEARDIHNSTVRMLSGKTKGLDVLTTFADISVADLQDRNTTTTKDDLQKVERTVYNNSGVSQNIFNAEGNLATQSSILNDESSMRDLIYQFQYFVNRVIQKFNRKGNYTFTFSILQTTIYNYKDYSKLYKEHVQLGYSKMLPQIALGHSQSSILATAQFENNVLHLSEIMIPPMSSATMNSQVLNKNVSSTSDKKQGRPEKDSSEVTEKTIANKEAMN